MPYYFRFSEQQKYGLSAINEFNDICFPFRRPHIAYDRYRFVENPFAATEKDYLYGVEKDGKYIAQMLSMPAPLSLNENEIPAFWGQDYFVLEDYRGIGIGKELANYYLKKDHYIAVGFSPKSAVIHQKMGARKIGYLDSYRKWGSTFLKIKFLFQRGLKINSKKTSDYQFPETVNDFERIKTADELYLPKLNWNKNVLESIRNKAYFEWRFFYSSDVYFVYQSNEKSDKNAVYFVCKPYFYKGVNWLKVVDYRFDNTKPNEFRKLLSSIEMLRKRMKLFGVLVSSSQKISNETLRKTGFTKYKHEIVLTTFPFTHPETDEEHNHFIISFADSDLDMHNHLGRFNFEKSGESANQ